MEKGNQEFSFSGIGTKWSIVLDSEVFKKDVREAVLDYVKVFEESFSRFLPNSETNAFRVSGAGDYKISKEFAVLLTKADQLRKLTDGVYDPAVGGLLEHAGYDAKYSMRPTDRTEEFVLPRWSISGETLTVDGPTPLDLGGIGKGYCIDQVSQIFKNFGHKHFLVDGGGDMYGTIKSDGAPWKVAIQYPGKPEMAAGTVNLTNQGVAVSDSFRRRWGKWHHLVNPKLKKSVELVVGAVAVAGNAWDSDCMTSALFFSTSDKYPDVSKFYNGSYLVFQNDGMVNVSANWKGELF